MVHVGTPTLFYAQRTSDAQCMEEVSHQLQEACLSQRPNSKKPDKTKVAVLLQRDFHMCVLLLER